MAMLSPSGRDMGANGKETKESEEFKNDSRARFLRKSRVKRLSGFSSFSLHALKLRRDSSMTPTRSGRFIMSSKAVAEAEGRKRWPKVELRASFGRSGESRSNEFPPSALQ